MKISGRATRDPRAIRRRRKSRWRQTLPPPEFSPAERSRISAVIKGVLPVREAIRAAFLRQEALLAAAKGFQPTALAKATELAAFTAGLGGAAGQGARLLRHQIRSAARPLTAHSGGTSGGTGAAFVSSPACIM